MKIPPGPAYNLEMSKAYLPDGSTVELPVPIPEGVTVTKDKAGYLKLYWPVSIICDHPLAQRQRSLGYHRYVLYEKMGRPDRSECIWCGYRLSWKPSVYQSGISGVHADHLDHNVENNHPDNLAVSCSWCNGLRKTFETDHPAFWKQWRHWMRDTPPAMRVNLRAIADDLGMDCVSYNRTE